MTSGVVREKLIDELLAEPGRFFERGRAYQLLQTYFEDPKVDSLRPLLRHVDPMVQRAAVFVASELGAAGRQLLDDVLPLASTEDRYLRYHALEVLAVCADGDYADRFLPVIRALESNDDAVRRLAMRLMANADISQVQRGLGLMRVSADEVHAEGLRLLLQGKRAQNRSIAAMLDNRNPLLRRYGAIAAKQRAQQSPELIEKAEASEDADVRELCSRESHGG